MDTIAAESETAQEPNHADDGPPPISREMESLDGRGGPTG
jgi:hypothetical protein